MKQIISADEIKKTLPNYSPDKVEFFHRESTKQADKSFQDALKTNSCKEVILLCGGTASGKTELLSTYLDSKGCIIFDATLSKELGAKIRLNKIIKAKKEPVIYAIIPDNLNRAFIAFLNRDRKFSDRYFYETHSGSRKTLLWIASNYPNVKINIIESSYTQKQILQFDRIDFESKQQLVDYLSRLQMSEDDIIKEITSHL